MNNQIKYKRINKACPVCGSKFEALLGSKREKKTCSYSCSNTHFRSGKNNGNYKHGYDKWGTEYRAICFEKHEYKCALCDWDLVVEVHHIDGDKSNNNISNLIPLCPNHHRLTIMKKYKAEVNKLINKWLSS